jgi:hypothetical protein
MAQLNIQTIAPTLNQIVSDIQTQFENQTIVYNAITKRGKKDFINGKGERIPSYLRRPTGISAGTEGFSFNSPGLPVWDDMFVYPAEVALPYELSERTIRNFNAGSEYTQIEGMSGYLAKIAEALTKDLERNIWGDGTGLRGTALSASGSVITFRTAAAASFGSTKGAVWVELGENYDLINGSTLAVRGQVRFTSKTATTATGTFVGFAAGDVVDGDFIVPANGLGNFPRGFAYIVNNDTGSFQLLSRSTYPELRANVVDLAGGAITVSDFDQAVSFLEIRGDSFEGAKAGISVWMAVAQHSALVRLGQNLKRFGGSESKFDGSFQTFGFGNLTINKAVDCCEDRLYFNAQSDLFCFEEKSFGVYDADGNQLRMKMGTNGVGSTSYAGAMGVAYQMGAYQPRKYTLIKRAAIANLPTQVLAYT